MNPQLQTYIQQAKAAGQTNEQIRQALLQAGWDAASVEEALGGPSVPPPGPGAPVPPPVVAGKKNPWIKIIIILVILMMLGGIVSAVIGFFVSSQLLTNLPAIAEQIAKQQSEEQSTDQIIQNTDPTDYESSGIQYIRPIAGTPQPSLASTAQMIDCGSDGDNTSITDCLGLALEKNCSSAKSVLTSGINSVAYLVVNTNNTCLVRLEDINVDDKTRKYTQCQITVDQFRKVTGTEETISDKLAILFFAMYSFDPSDQVGTATFFSPQEVSNCAVGQLQ